jgi:2-oxo-3-hexenedioate decarboxylase
VRTDSAAETVLALLGTGRSLEPPLAEDLDMPAAYAIAARIHERRVARGERPVGRKIGFTNTTIWPLYGVTAPMWGHVYDTTLHEAGDVPRLASFAEPRIEPEIVFGLGAAPTAGMDEDALLGCVAWVAAGFEIVQSVYPRWHFTLPEATAACGLHGALLLGRRHPIASGADWRDALGRFTVTLARDGLPVEQGEAGFVLGGPLRALRFLVETLDGTPFPLRAGELVSTGTLTDARPVAPGERWTATFHDLPVTDLDMTLQ